MRHHGAGCTSGHALRVPSPSRSPVLQINHNIGPSVGVDLRVEREGRARWWEGWRRARTGRSGGTALATHRQGGRGVGRAAGVSEGRVASEAGTWGRRHPSQSRFQAS